jgi:hypothetical protein
MKIKTGYLIAAALAAFGYIGAVTYAIHQDIGIRGKSVKDCPESPLPKGHSLPSPQK